MIDRRGFLVAGAAMAAACRRAKAPRYNGFAFVSLRDEKAIAAVSLSSFQLAKQIPVDSAPGLLIAHPQGNRVLGLLPSSGTIVEIDARTLAVERRSRALGPAVDMRLATNGRLLWVLLRDSVIAWDLDRWQRVTWIRLPNAPNGMDLDDSGSRVAIGIPDEQSLGIAELRNGKLLLTPLSAAPGFVTFQCKGKLVYAGLPSTRRIAAVNTEDARHLVDLPVPLSPRHYCTNADGGQMFVSGEGMDAVVIVSPYQTEVGETVLAGNAPGALAAIAGSTPYLFVANPEAGDTTVISIDTRRAVAQIHSGGRPSEIAFTPDGSYALILDTLSGNLAVFRLNVLQTATIQARRSRLAPLFTVVPVGAGPVSLSVCPLV